MELKRYALLAETTTDHGRGTGALPTQALRPVWIVQRYLAHYRIPVFDRLDARLRERGARLVVVHDRDRLEGQPDTTRPYLSPTQPTVDWTPFGVILWKWPGLVERIRAERPAAVVVEGTSRIVTNWRVPAACRSVGAASILWTKGHRELDRGGGFLIDRLRASFAARFTGIVCYGKSSRDDLVRLGIPNERISIAQNTIDTDRIFERRADLEAEGRAVAQRAGLVGKRIVLCPGTMYPKKRQLDLIEAWPRIRDAFPDAILVFIGGGENLEAVRRRAAEVDAERIRVVGRVPEGADYHWISAAEVTVFCGGLGLAINQSLAFGKATVVADEPGADGEILEHGATGWRYPRGDTAALASTIIAILRDRAATRVIAERGMERVQREVNLDRMVDGFVQALERSGAIPAAHLTSSP